MRGDSKSTRRVAVPASAANDASSAARSFPSADVAAGACGIAPNAHAEIELGVSYSGNSYVSDSGNAQEALRSPAVPRPSRDLPSERNRDFYHILFGSCDEYDYSSPQ